MKQDEIRKYLDEWCEEWNIDPKMVEFGGYADLGKYTMGVCTYSERSDRQLSVAKIRLSIKWAKRDLGMSETATLWHEMAHAIAYLEDGVGNGHDSHWREIRATKPKYVVWDFIAKLIFSFL